MEFTCIVGWDDNWCAVNSSLHIAITYVLHNLLRTISYLHVLLLCKSFKCLHSLVSVTSLIQVCGLCRSSFSSVLINRLYSTYFKFEWCHSITTVMAVSYGLTSVCSRNVVWITWAVMQTRDVTDLLSRLLICVGCNFNLEAQGCVVQSHNPSVSCYR